MSPELLEVAKAILPAVAAWVSVKVSIAVALEKSAQALHSASRAHQRIDEIMQNAHNK